MIYYARICCTHWTTFHDSLIVCVHLNKFQHTNVKVSQKEVTREIDSTIANRNPHFFSKVPIFFHIYLMDEYQYQGKALNIPENNGPCCGVMFWISPHLIEVAFSSTHKTYIEQRINENIDTHKPL